VEVFVHDGERVDLSEMMHTLHTMGIKRLMVEGGATLNFELIKLGLVDEVSTFVAPMIFGGDNAPTMAAGSGLERSEAVQLKLVHVENWDDGGVLLHYKVEREQ
jgi:2,5-diamino-6-(ribosylamino)-4(3H)-pyrimidinone 5'-phosphate reductase